MVENKTKPTSNSVEDFIKAIPDEQMKSDSQRLDQLLRRATGEVPKLWGTSIVGYGTHHYKYASGREGDTMKIGFSPRKQALTIYGVIFYDEDQKDLSKLGKFTTGKGCLYIKRLADIDEEALGALVRQAYRAKNA